MGAAAQPTAGSIPYGKSVHWGPHSATAGKKGQTEKWDSHHLPGMTLESGDLDAFDHHLDSALLMDHTELVIVEVITPLLLSEKYNSSTANRGRLLLNTVFCIVFQDTQCSRHARLKGNDAREERTISRFLKWQLHPMGEMQIQSADLLTGEEIKDIWIKLTNLIHVRNRGLSCSSCGWGYIYANVHEQLLSYLTGEQ